MRFAPFAKAGFVLVLAASFSACGGGGSGPPSNGPNPNPGGPPPATVTVSGKITFDRIPFDTTLGNGLNPNAPVQSPARGVVVEALGSTGSVLANTITDANGDYVVTVASSTQITIRAKAQMLKAGTAPTWNFQVRNNANGDALYALDSSVFDSGTANGTRNLRAASGWGGTSYTQTRAAAPFAILDTVYSATTLITSAQPAAAFEALNLYWSASNRSGTTGPGPGRNAILCIDNGDVQTTFYTPDEQADDCSGTVLPGIYVLGEFEAAANGSSGDTDEFDQHVIAHEFGHYIEDTFSRSDSMGGEHGSSNDLDMRVAFGEGWGNAFAGMVLNDPGYRDSFSGASDDFSFSLEQDFNDDGWYSEASVGEILWDVFDPANEPNDPAAAGFGPIFNAMSNGQRTTVALTSIFSFASALKNAAPAESSAINALLQNEGISGTDEFGSGENNDAGLNNPLSLRVLPVYRSLASGVPQFVCVRASDAEKSFNRLGFYKFFRFTLATATSVSFNLFGQADPSEPTTTQMAADPDIWIYRQGVRVFRSEQTGQSENETIQLPAGTYVVQLFDYDLIETRVNSTRCMTISATGI